jgi:glycosyltransferase involved in cell wall biosynthesis
VRVGLSLLTLVPGRIGGSETYARELLRALSRVGSLDYTVYASKLASDLDAGLQVEVVPEYHAARSDAGRLATMTYSTLRPAAIRRRLAGSDVVHFPLTVPIPPGVPRHAITLHDVQHLDLPDMFPRAERAFRRLAYDRAARNAAAVVAISAFGRDRIVELLGVDPSRVHAIPLGIDHDLFRPGTEPREPFLLYPARLWPHKNHARLLEAFALVRRDRPDLRLVLTGGGLDRLPARPGVEVRGNVTLETLADLYRRASCLVFPSLYEGFGLPPLEAMASGCPVASSNAAALPETCGDAAVFFDPSEPEAIAAAVLEALGRADDLRAAGFARTRIFTWDATAGAHEMLYRELAAG